MIVTLHILLFDVIHNTSSFAANFKRGDASAELKLAKANQVKGCSDASDCCKIICKETEITHNSNGRSNHPHKPYFRKTNVFNPHINARVTSEVQLPVRNLGITYRSAVLRHRVRARKSRNTNFKLF